MKASIVIPSYNKCETLTRVIASIRNQRVPFPFEIIVVDDSSTDGTPELPWQAWGVQYIRLEDRATDLGPAVPYNVGLRAARGEVIINQKDDVVHHGPDTIDKLVRLLKPSRWLLGTVWNLNGEKRDADAYCSPDRPRTRPFLASIWRRDIYRIGGYDEDFTELTFDDDYFGACLTSHGIEPEYTWEVVGDHIHHARLPNLYTEICPRMEAIYKRKTSQPRPWKAKGGAWEWGDGTPLTEQQ